MIVYLLATLDTKGSEIAFVRDRLEELGLSARIMDTGCMGAPCIGADVSRDEVFAAAGTSLDAMRRLGDRGAAVTRAAEGAAALMARLYSQREVDGVLGIGGSAGTTIATAAMQVLPLGVPKVMLSTLASGDVRGFVGVKDIVMINSVVDLSGLNRISRTVLLEAAHALAGMVQFHKEAAPAGERPLVAATMFGVTTPCVERARDVLEQAGYEVLVFHATGTGGQAMESLVRDGLIAGVLDLTTTELADELVGGVLSAGPDRLAAAGAKGIPQVISVGATDMVNFHGMDTVPPPFRNRKLYRHNANVTLMRTTPDECSRIGRDLARKVAAANGPAAILLPLRGVSAIDREGQPFDDPVARQALFQAVRDGCGRARLVELDNHINDPEFAEAAARTLMELMADVQRVESQKLNVER
jgi:uncharacterized protein (UPF0261 family)